MIVAVTGATGFVGRHLIEALAGEVGVSIRALARRPAKEAEAFGVTVVQGGLDDAKALAALTEGADAVVHCAGVVAAARPSDFHHANADGTAAMLRATPASARFVHVSSLAAREPALSAYAASKRRAEDLVARAGRAAAVVVVRPPAVYGPGDRATLPIFQQLHRGLLLAPGARAARFSLIFVTDLARLLARLALGSFTASGPVEPDDGHGGYGWSDLAAIAARVSGRRVRTLYVPTGALRPVAWVAEAWSRAFGGIPPLSRDKLRELGHADWVCRSPPAGLDWQPETDFARGFAETAAWYGRAGWL